MFLRYFSVVVIAAFATMGSAVAGQRAWVSGLGTDSVSCGAPASPCRTFQYAHDHIVSAGGSIYVKDSANYGQLTISKSIAFINDNGAMALVEAGLGVGVTVEYSGVVLLKGLVIDGNGSGVTGIASTNSGSLTIANCTIQGFTGAGVSIIPNGGGNVVISDSVIANNGTGIYTSGDSAGSLSVSLSRDQIVNNGYGATGFGVRVTGGSAAYQFTTIENSHISQNGTGLSVEANGSNTVQASLFDVTVVDNTKSINVAGGGSVRLERTAVQAAFPTSITNGGSIVSFGDNAITDSVTGAAITTTPLK
jgi:hypothetical protein